MTDKLELKIAQVIDLLSKNNINTYEIELSNTLGLSASVRLGKTEELQNYLDNNIGITVYNGNKTGYASSGDFSLGSINNIINAAKNIANYTEDDIYSGLAPKELLAWDYPNLKLYNKQQISIDTLIENATICENAALQEAGIKNSEGADISSFYNTSYYANSHGLLVSSNISKHSISVSVIAQNKGDMQSAYDYNNAISFTDLGSVVDIGKTAAKYAYEKLSPRKLTSQTAAVIFSPKMAASIFSNILGALSGSNQYNKNSFLLNTINKKIAPKWLNITEIPLQQSLLGSKAFDNDGVLKKQQSFIKDGVVKSYIMGQYSANQLGLKTTANAGGISNCYITNSANIDFNDLLKKMHTGLYITQMMGQGVNITTGNYSRGASGFWVENGIIQYPVFGITIADNLSSMLDKIVAISCDVDNRLSIKVGSMLIESMTISGG